MCRSTHSRACLRREHESVLRAACQEDAFAVISLAECATLRFPGYRATDLRDDLQGHLQRNSAENLPGRRMESATIFATGLSPRSVCRSPGRLRRLRIRIVWFHREAHLRFSNEHPRKATRGRCRGSEFWMADRESADARTPP